MGRGGSDLTATIIGNCIEAKNITFYKVECNDNGDWEKGMIGIIHPNKETISHLSFEEIHEMGKLGRTVLHRSTIEPIQNNEDITIYIKNTMEPEKDGTKITLNGSNHFPSSPVSTIMTDTNDDKNGCKTVHLIGKNINSNQNVIDNIRSKYKIIYKSDHSITLNCFNNDIFNLQKFC